MYYAFRANVDYDYPRTDESHPDQGRQIELLAEQYDGCQRDQHNPHAAPYRIGDPYGQKDKPRYLMGVGTTSVVTTARLLQITW